MELVDIYPLLILLILGGRVIQTDISKSKIYNSDLLYGLVGGLFSFILYGLLTLFWGYTFVGNYFLIYVQNGLLALVLGYVLWSLRVWAAGDAKLFFVLSLIIPISWYQNTYFDFFPALALLMNIIFPLFVWVVLRLFILLLSSISFRGARDHLSSTSWGNIFFLVLQYLGIYILGRFVLRILLQPFRDELGNVMLSSQNLLSSNTFSILSFAFSIILMRYIKKTKVLFIISILLSSGVVLYELFILGIPPFTLFQNFGTVVTLYFIFLIFFRVCVTKVHDHFRKEVISIWNLKPGDHITPHSMSELISRDKEYFEKIHWYADGLVSDQVKYIHNWYKENKDLCHPEESVEVYYTIRFAPWMLAGALLTFLYKGTFIYSVLSISFL